MLSLKYVLDVKTISKKVRNLDRKQRRHQAKQIRKNKREDVLQRKRSIGTENASPHVLVSEFIAYIFACVGLKMFIVACIIKSLIK